jgi:hypothetical protein
MPTRPPTTRWVIALAAALAVLAGSLSAATAAPRAAARAKAPKAPAVRALVDGVASDWDAAAGTVDLDAAALRGGPAALRRAVRRGAAVTVTVGPSTRIVVQDADGVRSRVTAGELFDALDLAEDDVELEASARVPRTARARRGTVTLRATRVVAYLPPAATDEPGADEGDDPGWDGGDDPGWDDGGPAEDPAPGDGRDG